MKPIFSIFFVYLIGLLGCNPDSQKSSLHLTKRDSLLQKIYTETDSFRSNSIHTFYDLETVFEKYLQNDTSFLKNISGLEKFSQQFSHTDSCIPKTDLRSLDCEEAYQYEYKGSLFLNGYYITTYKKANNYYIDFYRYTQGWDDTTVCKIDYQIKRKLTQDEWNALQEKLHYVDFWGLKSNNDYHGLDGHTETVFGYKLTNVPYKEEKVKKYHFVYRWSPSNTAFAQIGYYLVKLGGEINKY